MDNCYVLACGPSIKNQDLTYLQNKSCITLSNFFVHPEFENMNILYHIFGNLHYPITYDMGIAWYKEAEKKFKDGQKVMIHKEQQILVEDNNIFKNQEIIYWSEGGICPNTLPYHVDEYLSISHIALQMAIYIKPDNIYMMGIDHSWVNHVLETKHFYDESESVLSRMGYNEWFNVSNRENSIQLEKNNLIKLSNLYSKYRNIANDMGINVYNSTPNSMITILPIKNFNE